MENLEGLTRKEFLMLGTIGIAAYVTNHISNLFSHLVHAQTSGQYESPGDIFRREPPYNLDSLRAFEMSASRTPHLLTEEELRDHLEYFKRETIRRPILQGSQGRPIQSTIEIWIRLVPNIDYANSLLEEAKRSIDDIFTLLNPHIKKPKFDFEVVKDPNQVNFGKGVSTPFYLVAQMGSISKTIYEFDVGEDKIHYRLPFIIARVATHTRNLRLLPKERGYEIAGYREEPIFYSLAGSAISRLEAPAAEALHRAVGYHTMKHLLDEGRSAGSMPLPLLKALIDKYVHMEELLVHATVLSWLRLYNIKRNLGFTEKEFEEREKEYEAHDKYKGTKQLSGHIAKTGLEKGIEKAIELYISNPNDLFKVLK